MKFGERLKKLRTDADETQEPISKKLYISRQTISNWENERSYPDIEILIKLSNYYNISLDRLLKEDVVMKNKVIDDAKKKRKYRNIIKELVEVKSLSEKEYKILISHLVIRLA